MKEIFSVSGKKIELPAENSGLFKFEKRPGGWWIATQTLPNGSQKRIRFCVQEAKKKIWATLQGNSYYGEIRQTQEGATEEAGSDADLTAQFPGKIRKILCKVGQKVKAGEPLLLVEAMKMEFAVKAPKNGTVSAILVKEGAQISPGTRFVEVTDK